MKGEDLLNLKTLHIFKFIMDGNRRTAKATDNYKGMQEIQTETLLIYNREVHPQ